MNRYTFLNTKFLVPDLKKESLLKRNYLEKKILENIDLKLIHIYAPAGFGKTSFLYQIINSIYINKKIYWISLDKDFNNIISYLIYTFEKIFSEDLSILELNNKKDYLKIFTYIINECLNLKDEIYIFIDDIHLIEKDYEKKTLEYLIKNSPSNIHFILSGRSKTIDIDILKLRNQVLSITLEDLKFNKSQIKDFFKLKDILLDDLKINLIIEKTEGWVLSLKLASLFIKENNQIDAIELIENKYILEYLLNEVLNDLDDKIYNFIVYNSIFSKFNYRISNLLLDINNSQNIIQFLEQKNLFIINLDSKNDWFRFHNLISESLIKKLKKDSPLEFKKLCKNASNILKELNLFSEALNIAFMSEDIDFISYTLENIAPYILLDEDMNVEWSSYVSNLQEKYLINNKKLFLFYLISLIIQKKIEVYDYFTTRINLSALENSELLSLSKLINLIILFKKESNKNLISKNLSVLNKYIQFFDENMLCFVYLQISIAYIHIKKYSKFFSSLEKALFFTNSFNKDIVNSNILYLKSTVYLLESKFSDAEKILVNYYESLENESEKNNHHINTTEKKIFRYSYNRTVIYFIFFNLSIIYLEWNYIDKLKTILSQYEEYITKYGNTTQKFDFLFIKFNFELTLNNLENAFECLQKIKNIEDTSLFDHLIEILEMKYFIQKHEFYHISDESIYKSKSYVNEYLSSYDKSNTVVNHNNMSMYLFLLIDYYIEKKEFKEAITVINSSLNYMESYASDLMLARLYLNTSIILYNLNKKEKAITFLEKAMIISAKSNLIRIFIDKKKYIKDLIIIICENLEKTKKTTFKRSFPHKILSAINESNINLNASISLKKIIDPLSKKEKEILLLISKDMKQKDIAKELNISNNTIKTYMKRIYLKLNVSNKKDAILRSTDLGILK